LKLPRDTRAAIYEANGKSIEIEIPAGETCRKWQTYAIEGNRRRSLHSLDADRLFARPTLFVEEVESRGGVLFATVKLVDPSVYLARQQGRAHPRQYSESIADSIDTADRVPAEYQEGLSRTADHVRVKALAEHRAEQDVAAAEADLAVAQDSGEPTNLIEGRVERARRRLADIHSPTAMRVTPRREPSGPTEPEPPPVSADVVLRVLRDDDAASDIALRLGRPTTKLRSIVTALNELRAQGLVYYRIEVDDDGENPVGRWRRYVRQEQVEFAAGSSDHARRQRASTRP
jgi:hypothetical protein